MYSTDYVAFKSYMPTTIALVVANATVAALKASKAS